MSRLLKTKDISIIVFTQKLINSGGISVKGFLLLFFYYGKIILSIPFELLQFLIFDHRIKKTAITKDPIFILGHYRCGTTLLQKLLTSDKRFGYLTYYDALFPNTNLLLGKHFMRFIQWIINILKIKNPFFHNNILQLSDSDEEDDYLMNKASSYSAYWGMIYPKKWRDWLNGETQLSDQEYQKNWEKEYQRLIKFLTFKNRGKQLVLKSPANTGRVKTLLKLYPKAKFIYIYRNPYHLYYSLKNMWEKVILKYYSLQQISSNELDEIIFGHFDYLTTIYKEDKSLITNKKLIEISYEALMEKPYQTIYKIYSKLDLPDFESTKNDLVFRLESEKKYTAFSYNNNAVEFEKIYEKLGKYIIKWGYQTPEI